MLLASSILAAGSHEPFVATSGLPAYPQIIDESDENSQEWCRQNYAALVAGS
jgi:hypothetical protein